MTDMDRERLIDNIVSQFKNANKDIQLRQARIFYKADRECGQRVAYGLGITLQTP
jgi:catalase